MNGGLRGKRRPLSYLVTGLVALSAACSGQSSLDTATTPTPADTSIAASVVSPAVVPVATLSPNPPTLAATPAPSPQLPTAVATITPPAPPEATSLTPASEPSITPTSTEPPPTFTPPPPPPEVAGEHLIFGRPVPASAPQWTDKAYPYGSTRGGTLQPHHGVEFSVAAGTPVLAVAPGTVRVAGRDDLIAVGPQTNFYGDVVIVEHDPSPNGLPLFTLYGHLSEVNVVPGQRVAALEQLGLSGDTGVAYGPHLHFEVREGVSDYLSTRNPLLWLRPFSENGIVAGVVTFANGQLAHGVPITLRRVDGLAPYTATTSYADAPVNGDVTFDENFAVDDVAAGYYEVSAGDGRNTTRQNLWVYPGRTNFITLVLP